MKETTKIILKGLWIKLKSIDYLVLFVELTISFTILVTLNYIYDNFFIELVVYMLVFIIMEQFLDKWRENRKFKKENQKYYIPDSEMMETL